MYYILYKDAKNKYIYVFSIAILTTQSSAGYLSLAIFWAWMILSNKSSVKILYLGVLIFLSVTLYFSMPFLHKKVGSMYINQSQMELENTAESGRFHSTRKSLNALTKYPLFGRGISRRTAADQYSDVYGSYGILDMPARYGLLLGAIYFISLCVSLSYYSKIYHRNAKNTIVFFALIALFPVYFSQGVYQSTVNLLLMQTAFQRNWKKNDY